MGDYKTMGLKIIDYSLHDLSLSPVGVEHLIALLAPQCFQIPLTPRMFPVWDFVVGIFARKALLNMGQVLSTFSCSYLYE